MEKGGSYVAAAAGRIREKSQGGGSREGQRRHDFPLPSNAAAIGFADGSAIAAAKNKGCPMVEDRCSVAGEGWWCLCFARHCHKLCKLQARWSSGGCHEQARWSSGTARVNFAQQLPDRLRLRLFLRRRHAVNLAPLFSASQADRRGGGSWTKHGGGVGWRHTPLRYGVKAEHLDGLSSSAILLRSADNRDTGGFGLFLRATFRAATQSGWSAESSADSSDLQSPSRRSSNQAEDSGGHIPLFSRRAWHRQSETCVLFLQAASITDVDGAATAYFLCSSGNAGL
nr:hypothetical protein Iba_chr12aCG9530 [Ipomoea batatas]